jgi:two-component system phosphate regulon response regulator PhoB
MSTVQVPSRILIVEDEQDVRDLISLHLSREAYAVAECADGESGLAQIQTGDHDLYILDWMLPKVSGLDLIKKIRQTKKNTPILMVTARVEPADIVLGLESGADDYVTKPFDVPVLLARVRALLRRGRLAPEETAPQLLELGNLKIDLAGHEAFCGGEKLQLTRSEFNLLVTLAENQGKVLTRDQLIDRIRGEDISIVQRAIDTHIFGLRKKLGPCAELVETIRGVGYRIKTQ